ncbi:hypothetical protein [Paenibacillus campi]|uniref:hypothetical protein n=1 Tax=Paenibacillus campi TaxID=3106031 RepID=UPI002AFFECF3|nr:hypothetical protein [Paenibacillus sp. SGZ-1014]
MNKGKWSKIIKWYYVLMAVFVIGLVIAKQSWLEQGAAGAAAGWIFDGVIVVGFLIIVPTMLILWLWLRRWMERYGVERQLRIILLMVTVPMMLVIGYMLELVFMMLFIGLGGR